MSHVAAEQGHYKWCFPNACSLPRCNSAIPQHLRDDRTNNRSFHLHYYPNAWASNCYVRRRRNESCHSSSTIRRRCNRRCCKSCHDVRTFRCSHTDEKAHTRRRCRAQCRPVPTDAGCYRHHCRSMYCRCRSSNLYRRNVLRQYAKVRCDNSRSSRDRRSAPHNCRVIRRNGSPLRANHSRVSGIRGGDIPNLSRDSSHTPKAGQRRSGRGRNNACRR